MFKVRRLCVFYFKTTFFYELYVQPNMLCLIANVYLTLFINFCFCALKEEKEVFEAKLGFRILSLLKKKYLKSVAQNKYF
jgi:hypothetical protein